MFTLVDNPRMAELELTVAESRVFWAIASGLSKGSGSTARITTGEIADTLGMLQPNVSKAIRSLRDRRIIHRERNAVWQLNPWLIFAGSAEDWETATDDAPEPEWSRP